MLFNYLARFPRIEDQNFQPHLIDTLIGYWCNEGEEELHKEGDVCKRTWFITKGMIYLYFNDKHKGKVVFMLFRVGEVAIIPDSFMNGEPSTCYIVACVGTELLEISKLEMNEIHKMFPQSLELENSILAKIPERAREREALLCLEPEERIITFFGLYPELHPYSKAVKMLDKNIANYLHIDQSHYCKFKNNLYPKKSSEKLAYANF